MAKEVGIKIGAQLDEAQKSSVLGKINWRFIVQSAVVWVVANIIIAFLVSQGSSEDSVYIGVIYLAVIAAGTYIALRKNHFTLYKSALTYGITSVIIFAALDYSLINLFLEGNTFRIYHQWYIAVSYAIVLLIPLIPFSIKVFKLRVRQRATE